MEKETKEAARPAETPLELLDKATRYLAAEMERCSSLAGDAANCRTPFAAGVLVAELANRLARYREGGLQALLNIAAAVAKEAAGGGSEA